MNDAVAQLGVLANEWANNDHVPEVDWARVRSLEFQELLNRRNRLFRSLGGLTCTLCGEFESHVCPFTLVNYSALNIYVQYKIMHAERVLRSNIADLKLAISDQNLELVPDYEQRVEVLKELKFLEANSTVSLKGRVSCEVSLSALWVPRASHYS